MAFVKTLDGKVTFVRNLVSPHFLDVCSFGYFSRVFVRECESASHAPVTCHVQPPEGAVVARGPQAAHSSSAAEREGKPGKHAHVHHAT